MTISEDKQVYVYQLKVWILGISPMVLRRVLVRSDSTIADLHYTIQIAIGWSDTHLNQFHIHGKDFVFQITQSRCFFLLLNFDYANGSHTNTILAMIGYMKFVLKIC